jgi:hypothetical protein
MSTSSIVHLPLTSTPVGAPTIREIGNLIALLGRDTRQTIAAIDRAADEARRIRAEAQAIKDTGNPFHAERIRKLEARADELDAHHEALRKSIKHYGYLLVDAAPQIDASTTLRCAGLLPESEIRPQLVFDYPFSRISQSGSAGRQPDDRLLGRRGSVDLLMASVFSSVATPATNYDRLDNDGSSCFRYCRARCYGCRTREKARSNRIRRLRSLGGIGLGCACGRVIHIHFRIALVTPARWICLLALQECSPVFLRFSLHFCRATCK